MVRTERTVVITDALVQPAETERQLTLHPALAPWVGRLGRCRRRWFEAGTMLPLEWYAAITGMEPAALLASRAALPAGTVQCFVASPYHARVVRDRISVLPESMLPWREADAQALCGRLNPLLGEDGLTLISVGSALLLAASRRLDVRPASFASIAGHHLPNRHPEGADSPLLMRLTTEIQMLLNRQPLQQDTPHQAELPVHGLWFWAPCDWPKPLPEKLPAVATRNPVLHAVAEARNARLVVTEALQLAGLMGRDERPRRWLLAGEHEAALLAPRRLPWRTDSRWQLPQAPEPYDALLAQLRMP